MGALGLLSKCLFSCRVNLSQFLLVFLSTNEHTIDYVILPNASAMGFKPTGEKYVRLYTGTDEVIGNDQVIKATLAFYNSDMSVESLCAHIEDCKKMFPSVIARGIDVNKTGENVATVYLGVIAKKDVNGNPINRQGLMSIKSEDTLHYEAFFRGAAEFGQQQGYEDDSQIELICELKKPAKKGILIRQQLKHRRFYPNEVFS